MYFEVEYKNNLLAPKWTSLKNMLVIERWKEL
jgi:hypothetical protein